MSQESHRTIQFSFASVGAVLVTVGSGFKFGPGIGAIVAGFLCLAAAYFPRRS